jgi:hypothetical protein
MGHGSARPSTEASGPPTADASGAAEDDELGLSSAKVTGLRSPTSATTAALSSWPGTGRSGITAGNGASTAPDVGGDGRLRGRISDDSGRSRCRRRQQVSRARGRGRISSLTGVMAAPIGGSAKEACPMATRATCPPPLEGALRGGQPTCMARRSTGRRSCLRLKSLCGGQTSQALPPLVERKREQVQGTQQKTKTEVSSNTYPLRGKANRVCGEAPQAPIPLGAAEGCPPAGFGTVSASDARGAEGAACPGVVTTAEDRPPVQPARGPALGEQVDRPDPPESQQLSRPRGQAPPRPASAPRIRTLVSRPQALVVPAHLEAGSVTPGPASGPG